jgi:hypothetical protein
VPHTYWAGLGQSAAWDKQWGKFQKTLSAQMLSKKTKTHANMRGMLQNQILHRQPYVHSGTTKTGA